MITVQASPCKDFLDYFYDEYSYRAHQNWTEEEPDVKDTTGDLLFFQKGGGYKWVFTMKINIQVYCLQNIFHKRLGVSFSF